MNNLKRLILNAACIGFTAVLVAFPSECTSAATAGLLMFGKNVLPSIFPFFVVSGLYEYAGIYAFFEKLAGSAANRLFSLSGQCSAAYLTGLISGYPSGARAASADNIISPLTNTRRLALFCLTSNPGLVFTVSCVGKSFAGSAYYGALIYFSCVISVFVVSYLFINGNKSGAVSTPLYPNQIRNSLKKTFCSELVQSVTSAVSAILNVGGFIVLFCVLSAAVKILFPESILLGILTSFLEMSAGSLYILNLSGLTLPLRIGLTAALLGFGGFCVICQISEYLIKANVSVKRFLLLRLCVGGLAFMLAYGFAAFFIPH